MLLIDEGKKAPAFSLNDQDGNSRPRHWPMNSEILVRPPKILAARQRFQLQQRVNCPVHTT